MRKLSIHISGKWQHVKETHEIGEGKLFSPGNLRATFDNADYAKVYIYLIREKYIVVCIINIYQWILTSSFFID